METLPMHCSPSKEKSRLPRAPAGGRALEGPWVWSAGSLGSLVYGTPLGRSMSRTTATVSSRCSTRMALGEQHVKACLASVASSLWQAKFDSPRRQHRTAQKAPSSRRVGVPLSRYLSRLTLPDRRRCRAWRARASVWENCRWCRAGLHRHTGLPGGQS
jgi:hypothetical protein